MLGSRVPNCGFPRGFWGAAFRPGSELVPSWIRPGFDLVPTWFRSGSELDPGEKEEYIYVLRMEEGGREEDEEEG